MASIGVIFTSTYHTKQLNPWPNSSASRVVNYSQLSACQGDMEPFEGDLYTRGRLTSLRNKPQQKQPRKLSASIPGWIVSQCVQLLFDGEKCVLLLYAWKPAFLRSGHICWYQCHVCNSILVFHSMPVLYGMPVSPYWNISSILIPVQTKYLDIDLIPVYCPAINGTL